MFNNKKNLATLRTSLILLMLLALGIVMVLVMKMMVSMETGTIITALLVPLLAYLLLSGAIDEFGFVGVTAKLSRAASTEITLSVPGQMTPSAHDFTLVGEKGGVELEKMLSHYNLSEAKPIVLGLKLGRGDYEREKLVGFIGTLSLHRSFKLVVFLDEDNRVEAYMPFWAARQILTLADEKKNESEEDRFTKGEKFISFVNNNHIEELRKLPNVVKEPLTTQNTNAEALAEMTKWNLDALVVVDMNRCLAGVVERDEIVTKMILMVVNKSVA